MKGEDRAGPVGNGWTETAVAAGDSWQRQWTHASGVIRRDHGSHLEVIRPSGWRQYSGEGGGFLVFLPDGQVEVYWNPNGALSSSLATGQKYKITLTNEKRKAPELDVTFAMVTEMRASFIIPADHEADASTHEISGLPSDPADPRSLDILQCFGREAYQILGAIIRGDAEPIRRLAAAVAHHEEIRTGAAQVAMEPGNTIVEAIREAAIQADGPPARSKVLKEFNALVPANRAKLEIRDDLAKMGFGWLPAPTGKPASKVG